MPDDRVIAASVLNHIRHEYEDLLQGMLIDADSPLISSGLIDSLSMISLKVYLENTYGLHIPDAEATAEVFDTVTGIVALLRKLGVS